MLVLGCKVKHCVEKFPALPRALVENVVERRAGRARAVGTRVASKSRGEHAFCRDGCRLADAELSRISSGVGDFCFARAAVNKRRRVVPVAS